MPTKLYTIDDILNLIKNNYYPDVDFSTNTKYKLSKSFNGLHELCEERGLYSVTWENICQAVNNSTVSPKVMLSFVVTILDLGIYNNSHSESLYRLLPTLKLLILQGTAAWDKLFCGEQIDCLYLGKNSSSDPESKNSYYYIDYENNFLVSCMVAVLNYPRLITRWLEGWLVADFENSLGHFAPFLREINDFSEHTFWHQINYFKNNLKKDKKALNIAIRGVVSFYRWLILEYPKVNIFENAHSMSRDLLTTGWVINLIKDNYYVTTFNMNEDLGDKERVIFLLRGFDRFSTQRKKESFLTLNLSELKSSFYRKELWKYYLSSPSVSVNAFAGQIGYMASGLEFLHKLKNQPNYPNPLFHYFTCQEAVLLKNYIYDMNIALGTKNNRLGAIRRFLLWEKDSRHMFIFDNMFFSYLTQFEEPSKTSGNAVPDEDLIALNNLLVEKSETDHIAMLVHTIFHIAIQTEFRISQICSLTTNCIHPTIKPNQFEVHSTSKTSHGRKDKSVITEITYHLMTRVIQATEELRLTAPPSISEYIFLYQGMVNTIRVVDAPVFRTYLRKCCEELNLKRIYTAADLRDTHMTKSFEYILRNGKSDAEMSILSKHKYIDTSKSHYIEMELEKMLEATYGIIIGDSNLIDPDKNLVDSIPQENNGEDSIVEDGCGCCTAEKCVITSSLPCLACKHFVTTVAHEKFFVKAIENIDTLISRAATPHDKEDFITIKRLYVLYLKSIYKRKEATSIDPEQLGT
ncbi:hypothetical protein [Butyricicoccus pullicaecorum]|uniref:Tyr recombinase domain-containing protein n=1 Tax=Butyricicoccus pullicaecorum TaxID=501571 RepID=A0A1Y4LPX5_9FIRM|nr:hypothetical protein [Butyricicoccus pullicaecorum]OUP58743.1 hypothetical protein B5F15_06960 [Butyricicoccus pullicaecorum]